MAEFQTVADQFIGHYYNTFDTDRQSLAGLYRPESMLTWETESFLGTEQIAGKFSSLPFQQCKHEIITKDAQPTFPQPDGSHNGALVLVTGLIKIDEETSLKFNQVFLLMKDGAGSWFIYNDLIKLIFG